LSEKLKDIEVLHGDIPQTQREITFKGFKEGRFHILVATDVASRGLDIPDVDLIVQCEPPKDVETYIHRSGRTARAGKEGTVVTFYTKKHSMLITRIERMAGITFTKIGAPQPEDIIKASSKFIVEGLKKVTDEALPLFADTADLLVKEFGEKKALLLTLAYISGNLNKIKKRSMLAGTEGYVTYQVETDKEFRTVSYIWGILKRLLPGEEAEQIRQMRCYKNSKGAAFDVPEPLLTKFEAAYEQEKSKQRFMNYQIKRAQELPDLKDFEPFSNGYEPRGYGNQNNSYGRNGYGAQNRSFDRTGYSAPNHSYERSGNGNGNGFGIPGRSFDKGGEHYPSHADSHHSSTSHHHQGHGRSRSRSPPRNESFSSGSKVERNGFRQKSNANEVFMWGLKTEDDVKGFLMEHKIGWQRVKVLTGMQYLW